MADVFGYAASCAVLATFLMRTMVPLRLIAILSNVLFIVYGYAADIRPVLLLHLALLPINVYRLALFRNRPTAPIGSTIRIAAARIAWKRPTG